ncbi:gated mechanosensitive channel [Auriculariales sp. MPI-PUGE-AT-0066]|nr:gated mechanosensitive channel [Auriculariales sp. MPI-PUGE-AT-0066]
MAATTEHGAQSPTRTHHWTDASSIEERLHHAPSAIIRSAKGFWSKFQDFLGRDNILEVAVGLMIASAFSGVVNSLVTDMLMPFVSLLPFMRRNMSEKFTVLRAGPHPPYNTLEQAAADGAVTLAWGHFIDRIANFFVLGFLLYFVVLSYGKMFHADVIRHSIKCAYCRKQISEKSRRCAFCSSWLDGREDKESSALVGVQDGLPVLNSGGGTR